MSYYFISAFIIIIAYLMGSVCSAILVSQAFNLPDPRTEGSKNPGATNVYRLSGSKYAAFVLIFDVLKGAIPVVIAKFLPVSELVVAYTCLAAVMGHMFPIFFSFKGGKGVATAIGGLLGLQFILGVFVIGIWVFVVQLTRYVSVASLLSMTAMPFIALWTTQDLVLFTPLFFITLFIFYKHQANLTRLLDGEETKITFKRLIKNPGNLESSESDTLSASIDAGVIEQINDDSASSDKKTAKKTTKKPTGSARKGSAANKKEPTTKKKDSEATGDAQPKVAKKERKKAPHNPSQEANKDKK